MFINMKFQWWIRVKRKRKKSAIKNLIIFKLSTETELHNQRLKEAFII